MTQTQNHSAFQIAYYKASSPHALNLLKTKAIDLSITYTPVAESLAIAEGSANSPAYYVFRDHFMLVGPKQDPAEIQASETIETMIAKLYDEAERSDGQRVRWLSRFDGSATCVKETELWLSIGRMPFCHPQAAWFHKYHTFPVAALTAALVLGEYTLTDRGTYLTLPPALRSQARVFKEASDGLDDRLLNPAHLLIAREAENGEMARRFAEWVTGREGQMLIRGFEKGGEKLYSVAPETGEV
ncbi:hypothetical protein B7494_g5615 [Chlorociboria aeruginascens]|nr:hypothetical protein B7494_g5615 [Chlorociboria aeruginascens]